MRLMVKVGDKAPDFTAPCYWNGAFKEFALSSLKGNWAIVVFYPADFTFICPTELKGFQERYKEIKKMETEVVAISTDSEYTHKAWSEHDERVGGVTYPWVADKTLKISRSFDVLLEDKGIALRATFIIDPDGIIRYHVVSDLNVGRSVDEVIRTLQALQTGKLCPEGWEPGKPFEKGAKSEPWF